MRKYVIFILLAAAFFTAANAQQLTVVSASSQSVGVTADSLASVFGSSISTVNLAATTVPYPTRLGDISVVYITDSAGKQQMCGILFISQSQMNIYIPPAVAPGPATITFPITGLPPGVGTAALRSASVNIQASAPGLFSAAGSGMGVAAATGIRVVIPTQMQSPVPVFLCDAVASCVAVPIDVGVDAPVYLSFYGTGIRGAKNVSMTIGNTTVAVQYAGPQGQYPGLDQVNIALPLSLRGSGLANLTITADGMTSNTVQVSIQ